MPTNSSIFVAAGIFSIFSAVSDATARPPEAPSLSLVWNDAYELVPITYEEVAVQVTEIFETIGIRVSWTHAGHSEAAEAASGQVRVILMPNFSLNWSLPQHTMGVVVGEKVPRERVFISYSGVLGTMGFEAVPDRKRSPKERAQLTRALGRVIAHEVAHAIVPERCHDSDGLFAANLKRAHLKKSRLRFTDETATAFVHELAGK